MYSLVLMAALTTGSNACIFSCDPFPCYNNWCYCGPCCEPCWGYPWHNSYVSYYPYPGYCPSWGGHPWGPMVVIQEKEGTKKEQKKEEKREKEKEAKLVVELPADANLFIDGTLMKSASGKRGIVTPPLDPRQTYYYQVRVELTRHGHTLSETQRIRLIPGELVNARFPNLEIRAAAIVQAEKR